MSTKIYTKNFTVKELSCQCDHCKNFEISKMNIPFMLKLQKIRDLMAEPIVTTSAYRCKAHNEAVGGVSTSFHTKGRAVDIRCTDSVYRANLVQYAITAGCYGIGISSEFIHLDDRPFSQFKMWVYSLAG